MKFRLGTGQNTHSISCKVKYFVQISKYGVSRLSRRARLKTSQTQIEQNRSRRRIEIRYIRVVGQISFLRRTFRERAVPKPFFTTNIELVRGGATPPFLFRAAKVPEFVPIHTKTYFYIYSQKATFANRQRVKKWFWSKIRIITE